MSVTGNPTALRIGASGMLDGRRYTVRGRMVMSVMIDGETYYWNEFHLADAAGDEMTLVYEETEEGAEWKVFTLFEPQQPFGASAAATVRVGDHLDLGDRRARVTMVDESRVVFIEGTAPDGIYQGSVASFINAEAGECMIVLSWTGDDVEYYEGAVTSARRIEEAFGLPARNRSQFNQAGGDHSNFTVTGIVVAVMAILGFVGYSAFQDREGAAPEPPPKRLASPGRLQTGATGLLHGRRYRVRGHALVEISRLGDRFDEHEYALSAPDDSRALLVKALQGKSTDWYLLKPGAPPAGLGPFEAASWRQGWSALVANRSVQVKQLFQARVFTCDGEDLKILWPAGVQYGVFAEDGASGLVLRWNEVSLQFCAVETITDEEVRSAFGPDR